MILWSIMCLDHLGFSVLCNWQARDTSQDHFRSIWKIFGRKTWGFLRSCFLLLIESWLYIFYHRFVKMGKYWVERMDRVEIVKLDEICKNGWIFSALGGILLRYIKWVDFRWKGWKRWKKFNFSVNHKRWRKHRLKKFLITDFVKIGGYWVERVEKVKKVQF